MKNLLLFPAILMVLSAFALRGADKWNILATPDRADHRYRCGENATLKLQLLKNGQPVNEGTLVVSLYREDIYYSYGRKVFTLDLKKKASPEVSWTLNTPGFMGAHITFRTPEKKLVSQRAAVAFEPEKIRPGAAEPKDFMTFWKQELKAGEKLPGKVEVTPVPRWSNAQRKVYQVSFPAPEGRIYGFWSVPVSAAKVPAIVTVCWAGPGFTSPDIEKDCAVLALNIHRYSPAESRTAYKKLNEGSRIGRLFSTNYMFLGLKDKKSCYFRHGIIGAANAVKWLQKQPCIDPSRIGYRGISQGGGFGLILGGLLPEAFKAILVNVPALCDHHAFLQKRSPGWPALCFCRPGTVDAQAASQTANYYDAANFARYIKVPVRVICGYVDTVCPPGSVYAAYNVIAAQDKMLLAEYDRGHNASKHYNTLRNTFLKKKLRE